MITNEQIRTLCRVGQISTKVLNEALFGPNKTKKLARQACYLTWRTCMENVM